MTEGWGFEAEVSCEAVITMEVELVEVDVNDCLETAAAFVEAFVAAAHAPDYHSYPH